ncbi:MAG: hypothetical protein QOH10_2166 [Actinomycetota bacterium]|jgi:hypothetical protein|nr:hypothetical protein [Actinomycetota bacterium]
MYMAKAILAAQEVFGKLSGFEPESLLEILADVETVRESAEILGLMDVLDTEWQDPMREFLTSIPPAIDVAMMAVIRSSLARGLQTGISWQPGYAFELRVWDVSGQDAEGQPRGMVNLHLVSPDPEREILSP